MHLKTRSFKNKGNAFEAANSTPGQHEATMNLKDSRTSVLDKRTSATGLRKVLVLPRSTVFTAAFLLSIPAVIPAVGQQSDGPFVPEEN